MLCDPAAARLDAAQGTRDSITAEVSITASPIPSELGPGGSIHYFYEVRAAATNTGTAADVVVKMTVPPGLDFCCYGYRPAWTCTSPDYRADGGTLTCTTPGMVPGQADSFEVVAWWSPRRPGASCSGTATVTTSSPQDTTDDTVTTGPCTIIGAGLDLAAMIVAPPTAVAGTDAKSTIGVFNNSSTTAQGVSLSFAMPAGTTFVAEQQSQGPPFTCTTPPVGTTGSIVCTARTLGLGQRAIFDVDLHYVDTGNKISSLTVTSTTPEQAPADNTATGLTKVDSALLDVAVGGAGAGRVTSLPNGIDCTTSCSSAFAAGAPVSLNAAASPGSIFTGWGGACTGVGACVLDMTAQRSVTAGFATGGATFELTVARAGSGVGGVAMSVPSGIACGGVCAASYASGDVVTLTAADDERSVFIGWTGPCSGSGACVVTMSAATTVGAEFTLVPSLLDRVDLDADGRADLVFRSDFTQETFLMRMNGIVVVDTARPNVTADWSVVHTGDFNGDGRTDLVWRQDVTGETALWLMNGTTYLSGATLLADPAWRVTLVGDFDGDGKSDLVWRNDVTGATAIWLMDGAAMKASAIVMADARWRAALVADLDGDGKSDLVWRNDATGETAVWIVNGAAFVSGGVILSDPLWSVTLAGDFDGDHKADLVWRNVATGETAIWLMNGAAFASGAVVLANPAWAVTHAADLDGDGRADLVFHNGTTGETALWLMNGLSRGATARLADTEDYDMLRAADLNGDGKADLVWRNRVNGQTKVWLMDGLTQIQVQPIPLAPVDWVLQ
jgi:uncharacterized repeat protein (TIGR01451 family)